MTVRGWLGANGSIVRASVLVVGALAVLQSSQDVGAAKIAYFGVALIAVLGSVYEARRSWHSPIVSAARPWLLASLVLSGLVALTLPLAIIKATPISAWVRDAAAYGLVAAAPWVALDLGLSASRRAVLGLTVLASGAATLSYLVVWIQRREIADLSIDRLVLPSFVLATALFSLAVALSLSARRHRFIWTAVACLTIGILVVAGTRATLVILLISPVTLGASWLTGRTESVGPKILAAAVPILVAVGIVTATLLRVPIPDSRGITAVPSQPPGTVQGSPGPSGVGALPSASPAEVRPDLTGRYDTFGAVLAGNDPSLRERLSQTWALWAVFLQSPLVGTGLGATVSWVDSDGRTRTDTMFTADTPVLVLAKFGILGLVIVGVLAWATISTVRTLLRRHSTREASLILIAFATGMVALTPLGWQVEDKGTGLAIVLLVGLALVDIRESIASVPPIPVPEDLYLSTPGGRLASAEIEPH
jgi:hypothetical protein